MLEVTCRVAAPLLPLTTERIWQGLTGGRSVHLADWPAADGLPHDAALVAAMDRVRQVASSALSLRKAGGLRVRQPLARLTVAAADAGSLAPFADILADEVNVKDVALTTDVAAHGRFEIAVNARACGPRLGGGTQKVIRAVKAGDGRRADGVVLAGGIELLPGEVHRSGWFRPADRGGPRDHGAARHTRAVVLDPRVTRRGRRGHRAGRGAGGAAGAPGRAGRLDRVT